MASSARLSIVARGDFDFNPWKPPNRRLDLKKVASSNSSSSRGSGTRKKMAMMSSPPGLGSFKPPNLGFGRVREESVSEEEKEAMVDRLRQGSGSWHARAKTIWELQQLGYTSEKLYDVGFVSPLMQTAMVVAAKVYDSLVLAQSSSELLSALERDESHICSLYELRILSNKQRKAAAEFLFENGLDAKGAEELARAIKQHERRAEFREGFSPVPGDCLALMHYRAATESSQLDEKRAFAGRALELAVSEPAISKISTFLQNL